MYCHRWWLVGPAHRQGTALCTLQAGHGGTYCIDTFHNRSTPRAKTNLPKHTAAAEVLALVEEVLART